MTMKNQNDDLDDLMREAEELRSGKKRPEAKRPTIDGPKTFLEYGQKAAMYNGHRGFAVPVLALGAAVGRLNTASLQQINQQPLNEEQIAKDLAMVLYYLSSSCDQLPVTLEQVAAISLSMLESNNVKKLKK